MNAFLANQPPRRSCGKDPNLYRLGSGEEMSTARTRTARKKKRDRVPYCRSPRVEVPARPCDRAFPRLAAWLPPNPTATLGGTRLTGEPDARCAIPRRFGQYAVCVPIHPCCPDSVWNQSLSQKRGSSTTRSLDAEAQH